MDQGTLFVRLGGAATLDAAAELLCQKMLTDPLLSRYFDGVDAERQSARLAAFLRMALGGPGNYAGADLRTAHAKLDGLGDEHVDRVLDHLKVTLRDLGVAEPDVRTAAGIVGSARDDVLNR